MVLKDDVEAWATTRDNVVRLRLPIYLLEEIKTEMMAASREWDRLRHRG
jgi:hypothetical protein